MNIEERAMSKKSMYMKIRMSAAGPLLLTALSVILGGCSGNNNGSTSTSTPLPASTFTAPSATQGSNSIIALDPVNQAIWVPSYTLDAGGNLQYELISTAAAVSGGTAASGKAVSLSGCNTPIGIAYAASISALLVECGNSTTQTLSLSAVDAKTLTATPIATPGLTWPDGDFGGIIFDPQHSQAVVAGSLTVGLLQVPAGGAPSFDANSVTAVPFGVGTMAMNFTTQQVLMTMAGLQGPPSLLDASTVNAAPAPALTITPLPLPASNTINNFNGAAFDSATNLLAVSSYISGTYYSTDNAYAFNMATLNATATPPSVDTVSVTGFLDYYVGFFAGGEASVNAATHQVLMGDAWGPNLLLIQMPTAPVAPTGSGINSLDNNGQPGPTGLPNSILADGNSVYAVAQTQLPTVSVAGVPTQLNEIGDPPALAIDQVNNVAYVLADTSQFQGVNTPTAPHAWTQNAGLQLVLVSVDLSAPVPGGCPGANNFCFATWNARNAEVVVP
jgi:hypothetical protein